MKTLLVASSNRGKVAEFETLFSESNLNWQLKSLRDFEGLNEPIEDGESFLDNARIKARSYFDQTGEACLADDSGLEVEALDGAPGVYSARYAGEGASDQENNKKLLEELVGHTERKARFCCALVVWDGKHEQVSEGQVEGEIIHSPKGEFGFGYDPLFFVPSAQKTFAQMSMEEKLAIDHRAEAFKGLVKHFDLSQYVK